MQVSTAASCLCHIHVCLLRGEFILSKITSSKKIPLKCVAHDRWLSARCIIKRRRKLLGYMDSLQSNRVNQKTVSFKCINNHLEKVINAVLEDLEYQAVLSILLHMVQWSRFSITRELRHYQKMSFLAGDKTRIPRYRTRYTVFIHVRLSTFLLYYKFATSVDWFRLTLRKVPSAVQFLNDPAR